MSLNDQKRKIIESKRGKHAATNLTGPALDKALLAIFPDVRADSVDDFARGYFGSMNHQQRLDAAEGQNQRYRNDLATRNVDTRFMNDAQVDDLHRRMFGRR